MLGDGEPYVEPNEVGRAQRAVEEVPADEAVAGRQGA
jgi:hypothetical protein